MTNDLKELARFPAARGAAATMDFDAVLYFDQGNPTPYIVWDELTGSKARSHGNYCVSLEHARLVFVSRCENYSGEGNLAPEFRAND